MSDEDNVIQFEYPNIQQQEMVVPKMPKSIANSINAIMSNVKILGREDKNTFHKYSYASIDKFLEMVNPLCSKHGLIILIDEDDCKIERDASNKPWLHILYKFTLCHKDGDTWGYRPKRNMFVEATGGQSMGSSQSYTLKQYMRALFLIPTGETDDLDGHEKTMSETKLQPKKTEPKKEEPKNPLGENHTTQRRQ
jgi:hypothetical protein|tara:strand:- start:758 stop:1342 length:585 start_codon:yes stop_codon:yes gene_type:complete